MTSSIQTCVPLCWQSTKPGVQRTLRQLLAGALLQEDAGSVDEDARARDAMYERAERLAAALARMGQQLRSAIDNVNTAAASQVLYCIAARSGPVSLAALAAASSSDQDPAQ